MSDTQRKIIFSAPPSLASIGVAAPFSSLLTRTKCFLLVNDARLDDEEIRLHFVVKVDRGVDGERRMSTNFRSIYVTADTIKQLILQWKFTNFKELTGGSTSGPQGRRNAKFVRSLAQLARSHYCPPGTFRTPAGGGHHLI